MTDKVYVQGRVVASKLIRFDNHPWAWTPISDLAELFGRSPVSIWEEYCFDARADALASDWSGKSWKFALPQVDWEVHITEKIKPRIDAESKYEVADVWDMRTGEKRLLLRPQIDYVLIPAGWSKNKKQETQQLEKAVRHSLETLRFASKIPRVDDSFWEPARKLLDESIQAIGSVANLDLVLGQIASSPDALFVKRNDFHETNEISLKFSEGKSWCKTVDLRLRMVLGSVRLVEARPGDLFS